MALTTKLEAINTLLSAIGSTPVNSVDTPMNADAVIAHNHIQKALRDVQTEKWYFNTEEHYPLHPNIEGVINLPKNIVNIDNIGQFGTEATFIVRGTKLYDRYNHTYKINQTVYANLVLCLDFEELPETAVQYVIAKAARKYQEEMLGDPSMRTWTKEDESLARGRLLDEDLRVRKPHFGALPKHDPSVLMDFRDSL